MSVKIGHSSIDERGKASGGSAGDQTGREVCIRDWYAKGWTVLLRPKDAGVAERMARACEAGCGNDRIGYDQNQRNTLRARARECGWDLSKISTACECDCSSFMAVCAEAAGVPMDSAYTSGNAPTTRNMRTKFVGTGAFEALTDKKYLTGPDWLRRGDVLVYEGHHTVMVLSDGAKVEPTKTEQKGGEDMTGEEIYKKLTEYLLAQKVPDWVENGDFLSLHSLNSSFRLAPRVDGLLAASAFEVFLNGALRPLRAVNIALGFVPLPGVASLQFVVDRRGMHAQLCGNVKRAFTARVPRFNFLPVFKRQIPILSRHAFTPLPLTSPFLCRKK